MCVYVFVRLCVCVCYLTVVARQSEVLEHYVVLVEEHDILR